MISSNHFSFEMDSSQPISLTEYTLELHNQAKLRFLKNLSTNKAILKMVARNPKLDRISKYYMVTGNRIIYLHLNQGDENDQKEVSENELNKVLWNISLSKKRVKKFPELSNCDRNQLIHLMIEHCLKEIMVKLGNIYLPKSGSRSKTPSVSSFSGKQFLIWRGFSISSENDRTICIRETYKIIEDSNILTTMKKLDEKSFEKLLKIRRGTCNRGLITRYRNNEIDFYTISGVDWSKSVESVSHKDRIKKTEVTFKEYYKQVYNMRNLSRQKGLIKVKAERGRDIFVLPELSFFCSLSDEDDKDYRLKLDIERAVGSSDQKRLDNIKVMARLLNDRFKKFNFPIKMNSNAVLLKRVMLENPKVITSDHNHQDMKQLVGGFGRLRLDGKDLSFLSETKDQKSLKICVISDCDRCNTRNRKYSFCNGKEYYAIILDKLHYLCNSEKRWRNMVNERAIQLRTVINSRDIKEWTKILNEMENESYDGVLCILPRFNDAIVYGLVNLLGLKSNIITQCVLQKNCMDGIVPQKLLDAILRKNGEIPWKTSIKCNELNLGKAMIIGLDVCHSKRSFESTIGFTSTLDFECTRFFEQIKYQKLGVELVEDIDQLFENSINAYFDFNNCYPNTIIYYRDGVSDKQMQKVVDIEVKKVKNVLQSKEESIKLLVVVCQKRVSTRFFIDFDYNHEDKFVAPGFIVDKRNEGKCLIVNNKQEMEDFYLVSTKAPKNKQPIPTRYWMVFDDGLNIINNGNAMLDIENLTYARTLMYYDFAGSIRVPSVVKLCDHNAEKFSEVSFKHEVKKHFNVEGSNSGKIINVTRYNKLLKNKKRVDFPFSAKSDVDGKSGVDDVSMQIVVNEEGERSLNKETRKRYRSRERYHGERRDGRSRRDRDRDRDRGRDRERDRDHYRDHYRDNRRGEYRRSGTENDDRNNYARRDHRGYRDSGRSRNHSEHKTKKEYFDYGLDSFKTSNNDFANRSRF